MATATQQFDIAARQRQVVGDGPRIEPLGNDQLDAAARALVDDVRAGAGAGPTDNVPEYMRTMIKHPALFKVHMEMGSVLFRGTIPAREREIAILRIGWLCRAPYEFGQHVEIAKRVGLTTADVERAIEGSGAAGWRAHEAAILSGVEELLEDKAIAQATWDRLAETWNETQMIEFPMMVGQYVATAFVQNSIRSRLEDVNPGLTHR